MWGRKRQEDSEVICIFIWTFNYAFDVWKMDILFNCKVNEIIQKLNMVKTNAGPELDLFGVIL